MSQRVLQRINAVIGQYRGREITIDDLQGRLLQLGSALDRTCDSVSAQIRQVDFDLETIRFLVDSKDQFQEAIRTLVTLEFEVQNRIDEGFDPGEA